MGTFVKICGFTRLEDASLALDLGAQALGFNFYTKSTRNIAPEKAKAIVEALSKPCWTVGVFVNHSREEISRIVTEVGLNTIQLHGDEPPEMCEGWGGVRVIKALRIGAGAPQYDVAAYLRYADFLLLDRFDLKEFGGTGKTIEDDALRPFAEQKLFARVLLSGGITPGNAAEKIARYHPFGIDVASGVESEPGLKAEKLIRELIQAVEEGDRHRV